MNPTIILSCIAAYFLLLFFISYITGKNDSNDTFFLGNRDSPWFVIAYGMIGTTIGLIIGLIAPIPGGILIGPFLGAFVGELLNKSDSKTAIKAAFGSFLGFLTSAFIKFIVAIVYLGIFLSILWDQKSVLY